MNKDGRKNFNGWIKVKKALHYRGRFRSIKEGEIWWGSIGENVGVEICGKGKAYTRPVVIFKKVGKYSFLAIPLTSKRHKGSWYISFDFQGRTETAIVAQIHCMSIFRLQRKMGQLTSEDYGLIYNALLEFIRGDCKRKNAPQSQLGEGGYSRKSDSIIARLKNKVNTSSCDSG